MPKIKAISWQEFHFNVRGYDSIRILYTFTKMVSCDWPWDFWAFIRSSSSELEIEDDSSVDDLVWFSNKLLTGRFVDDWKRDSGRQDCFNFRWRVCSSVVSSWFDDSVLLDCPANKELIKHIKTDFVIQNHICTYDWLPYHDLFLPWKFAIFSSFNDSS